MDQWLFRVYFTDNIAKGGQMTTKNTERHKRWKEKQLAAGKRTITVMVDDWIKEMIDEERKRVKGTIAGIIERAVINYIDPSKTDSTVEVPVEEIQGIANDMLGVVRRIEKVAGIKAAVTGNK
jgi:hypothetical protein